jgi:NAD(P)-dependent dehydrogenase (short-subunit alcohol dehydrogenase family)
VKYAIVTGGARGLGLGIVNALLEEKVVEQVAVIDRDLAPRSPPRFRALPPTSLTRSR